MTLPFFDVYIGDKAEFERLDAEHTFVKDLLAKNAHIYGFPDEIAQLSDEQKEILQTLHVIAHQLPPSSLAILTRRPEPSLPR